MHVERKVGQGDLGLGTGDANGANEQAHFRLLMREDMLDPGADFGFGGVAAPIATGGVGLQWFAAENSAFQPVGDP